MLSENAFKEMPSLADKSSDFGFSSGIQVYFWTQRLARGVRGTLDMRLRLGRVPNSKTRQLKNVV